MTYVDALRPSSRRRDARRHPRQSTGRHQAASTAPEFHPPYDHRMSDRFRPTLSTR